MLWSGMELVEMVFFFGRIERIAKREIRKRKL